MRARRLPELARHHRDRALQVLRDAFAVAVFLLVSAHRVEEPVREGREHAALRVAPDRRVQGVAVRDELDEPARLHLAGLVPRDVLRATRAGARLDPFALDGEQGGHAVCEEQRVQACVVARVRVVGGDEDGSVGQHSVAPACALDLVERQRVPVVRHEVLEECDEVARGDAVRVEGRPFVHDVVHHDREKTLRFGSVGVDAWSAHDSQREAGGAKDRQREAHHSNR